VLLLSLLEAAPANAGTLTQTSFSTSANNRYDWAFTTATSSTLSKATMTVPAGTATTNNYLALGGIAGNYASTPDSVANSITGDIDIRTKVALADWTPAVANVLPVLYQQLGLGRAPDVG
jgi:hypothetical protein